MKSFRKLDINKLRENVEKRLDSHIADNSVGYAEIAVLQEGESVLQLSKGGDNDACPDMSKKPALFRIASMTKPVTAVAFLQQWEKGLLDLNAPLADYLPEFKNMVIGHSEDGETFIIDGAAKHSIRLVNLLSHTSGIDCGDSYDVGLKSHPRKTLRETAEFFSRLPLCYEPTAQTGYSESGAFDIIARLVEILSGESYGDYVKKHIFAPLEMNSTGFEPTTEQNARLVPLHGRADGKSVALPTVEGCVFEDMPYSCTLAGAGIFSSTEDYCRFAEMLRLGGTGKNGERVLTKRAVQVMSSPHVSEDIMPGCDRWGLGLRVVCGDSHLPRGTFGWSGAYGSHFFIDPTDKITAVYMRNSRHDSNGCGSIGFHFEQDVMNSF